jgi:hypothetical protein
MKCLNPNCNKELVKAIVISECWQHAEFNDAGDKLVHYEHPVVEQTIRIECPYCLTNITDIVKEG